MKKSKIIKALGTALLAAAAFTLVACNHNTPEDNGGGYKEMTDEYQTYYILNSEETYGKEVVGWHFVNETKAKAGFIVKEIYIADDLDGLNKKTIWSNGEADSAVWWGFTGDNGKAATIADGVLTAQNEGTEDDTALFGFAAGGFGAAKVTAIVAKRVSADVTGDKVTLVPHVVSPSDTWDWDLKKPFDEAFLTKD